VTSCLSQQTRLSRNTIPCWTADNKIHIALHIWSSVGQRCSVDLRDRSVTTRPRVFRSSGLTNWCVGEGNVGASIICLLFNRIPNFQTTVAIIALQFFFKPSIPTSVGCRWCTWSSDTRKRISVLPKYLRAYTYTPAATALPASAASRIPETNNDVLRVVVERVWRHRIKNTFVLLPQLVPLWQNIFKYR